MRTRDRKTVYMPRREASEDASPASTMTRTSSLQHCCFSPRPTRRTPICGMVLRQAQPMNTPPLDLREDALLGCRTPTPYKATLPGQLSSSFSSVGTNRSTASNPGCSYLYARQTRGWLQIDILHGTTPPSSFVCVERIFPRKLSEPPPASWAEACPWLGALSRTLTKHEMTELFPGED